LVFFIFHCHIPTVFTFGKRSCNMHGEVRLMGFL
jgi:hypothetical protein